MWEIKQSKMVGEDALRTVECLRGRLQAERAASRDAEHNALLMSNKLKELEKQLKIEAKSRRKAEKKLNFLKKKLESLNIPFNITVSEEFDGSISSNSSEISYISSITSTRSLNKNQQDEDLIMGSQVVTSKSSSSITSEITEERESESSTVEDISKRDQSDRDPTNRGQHSDQFCHGLEESSMEKKSMNCGKEKKQGEVDDEMALVVVTSLVELDKSSNKALEVKSENVREVLDTLKHIRENLHNSLQKRRFIKVGSPLST